MCRLNIERVTGKTRISYSGDVCKLVESKAFLVFLVLKLVERFSHHCLAKKELNLTTKPFIGRTLCGLLIQMKNISLRSSGMRWKFMGLKVSQWSLLLLFALSPSLLFRSSYLNFFFYWALRRLHFSRKRVFGKAFRFLGLDDKKGWAGNATRFTLEIIRSTSHGFLPFSPASLTHSS